MDVVIQVPRHLVGYGDGIARGTAFPVSWGHLLNTSHLGHVVMQLCEALRLQEEP
jgi:hypothetical protein